MRYPKEPANLTDEQIRNLAGFSESVKITEAYMMGKTLTIKGSSDRLRITKKVKVTDQGVQLLRSGNVKG